MKPIKIAYIGGGSRLWARKLMSDLAMDNDLKGIVSLYDIDQASAKTNAVIGNRIMKLPDASGGFSFSAAKTLEESLQSADFVFISIMPATYKEMSAYVHIPEKYGIYQSVGDSAGVGGFFRSLIMMPMYEIIAKAIEKTCPNAWVINFTNPMSMCLATLYQVFPKIKAFGNCHEVFATQKLLAKALEAETKIQADYKDILINPMGINHFTWIDKASYGSLDLLPIYRKYAERFLNTGIIDQEYRDRGFPFASSEKVKINLFFEYGSIAAAGDRHLVEFFPNNRFLSENPLNKWGFYLTPISYRIERRELDDEDAKMIASGELSPKLDPSGEEGIRQVRALLGLEEFVTNVNLPNRGQINNLPMNAVVETNAYFKKDSVQAIHSGSMDDAIAKLTIPHINIHNKLIDCYLKKELQLAKSVLKEDPTLVNLDPKLIELMFDEVSMEIKDYLAYYKE